MERKKIKQPGDEASPKRTGDMHTKYRPKDWDEVVGQDAVVKSLKDVLKKGTTHAFLFTGTSGAGKTTLGRIIASKVGCTKQNLTEIDAATNTGVEAMREVTASMNYSALGESSVKVYLIDESHRLSAAAWSSLLKPIEEPPPHVYWIFCTTEPTKVPVTISNRCATYGLKPVSSNDLYDLLVRVRDAEGLTTPDDVLYLIAAKADGSPRRALTCLTKCAGCNDRKDASDLIDTVGDESEVIEFCRGLMKGGLTWQKAMKLLEPHKDVDGESIRRVVVAYFSKAAMGAKGEEVAMAHLAVLDAFGTPYPTGSGITPILLSLGSLIFEG